MTHSVEHWEREAKRYQRIADERRATSRPLGAFASLIVVVVLTAIAVTVSIGIVLLASVR